MVPVDISVPRECRVLTISGPNTGGKTATMKTIALCLHMAKCGLFLHTRPGEAEGPVRGKTYSPPFLPLVFALRRYLSRKMPIEAMI